MLPSGRDALRQGWLPVVAVMTQFESGADLGPGGLVWVADALSMTAAASSEAAITAIAKHAYH